MEMKKNRISNLKKSLEDEKTFVLNQLEAWRRVCRASKKDGSDFVAKSKNFINAKYECESYNENGVELKIWFKDAKGFYQESYIQCYEIIDGSYKDERKKNAAVKGGYCSHPKYLLNVDEIFEKIEQKKQYLSEKIDKIDLELKKIETTEKEANQLLNNVLDFLEKHKNDELKYVLQNEIKDNIY